VTDYPGRAERELARSLIEALPTSVLRQLRFGGADLQPAAEHVLYTALRRPLASSAPDAAGTLLRGIARPIAAQAAHARAGRGLAARAEVVVLITQPVHARLFRPITDWLLELGEPRPLVVAARTGEAHVPLDGVTGADLRDFLPASAVPRLTGHAVRTSVALRKAPSTWSSAVDRPDASRLSAILRAAIPRLAIDVARLAGLLDAAQPRVVVCFSESGLLARLAPAAAAPRGIPVLDLPHAEAADPWGTSGVGYEGVAVFGPRAADAMRLAGVTPRQIAEIGPLGYDDLRPASWDPDAVPRRVLFASQPADEGLPYRSGAVKRLALESAIALAHVAGPAAVHVLPHPTEDERELHDSLAGVARAADVPVEIEPTGRLHELLPGAFALVTVSSQSVYEAVVTGVPAITVHPVGTVVPVSHVADGVALGASSVQEARRIGESLLAPDRRSDVTHRARLALGDRLGPLDGRAAERAAQWLHDAGR
jgi:hypothetical protein